MPLDTGVTGAIESLILPPGGLILLFLLGLMLGRTGLGRLLTLAGLAALYLLSTPFVADRLAAGLEVYPALDPAALAQPGPEAIVVLGAGRYPDAPEYGGDTVNALMLVRLRYAAWLKRRTGLPLVVSGGPAGEARPEAVLAKEVLEQELQVPVAATEDRSRTTRENALYTHELLERQGYGPVYLVTHAWHMRRAAASFERAGVEVVPAPTGFIHTGAESDDWGDWRDWLPSAQAARESYLCLHEYLGALWYRLT
ncbi:MAG: YdcF family protein [Chromatiales bacterium]